jgi:hypothetical protein
VISSSHRSYTPSRVGSLCRMCLPGPRNIRNQLWNSLAIDNHCRGCPHYRYTIPEFRSAEVVLPKLSGGPMPHHSIRCLLRIFLTHFPETLLLLICRFKHQGAGRYDVYWSPLDLIPRFLGQSRSLLTFRSWHQMYLFTQLSAKGWGGGGGEGRVGREAGEEGRILLQLVNEGLCYGFVPC